MQASPQPAEESSMIGGTSQPTPCWFATYTYSHHEKRVADLFAEQRIESFVPLYAAIRQWKNRCRVKIEQPLFPNYVFVRIDLRERVRVLKVPGVISLVSCGRTPVPLSDAVIAAIRSAVVERTIQPHAYLVAGERVRITTGAMAGMEGVLVRQKNNFRVVVTLEALMRSVAVEIDADDLQPAPIFTS
jgi:transcription antitermination factor NusG